MTSVQTLDPSRQPQSEARSDEGKARAAVRAGAFAYFVDMYDIYLPVLTPLPASAYFASAGNTSSTTAFDPDAPAIIGRSQTRGSDSLSWAQLRDEAARVQAGLKRLGVQKGDRVVAYLPNIAETVVAYIATIGLGATWSACAPE
jgi:non-ribosomal peptide synthetase component F